MAEVTVIAPNVVEFVGNLARQTAPTAERAFPLPPPPPRPETPLKPREDVGQQRRRLAANRNTPLAAPATPKTTSPGGFNPIVDPRRRPSQPSTQFLAQQIAQESASTVRAARPFPSALAAYERSRPTQPRAQSEPVIITRSVDTTV